MRALFGRFRDGAHRELRSFLLMTDRPVTRCLQLRTTSGPLPRGRLERTTISQRKSKTTEAVANRGVDADAPCGENEDHKNERKLHEAWNTKILVHVVESQIQYVNTNITKIKTKTEK